MNLAEVATHFAHTKGKTDCDGSPSSLLGISIVHESALRLGGDHIENEEVYRILLEGPCQLSILVTLARCKILLPSEGLQCGNSEALGSAFQLLKYLTHH